MDIGQEKKRIFFQVKWDGLPDERDFTWNPISQLFEDLPDKVKTFLNSTPKEKLSAKAAKQLIIPLLISAKSRD